MPAIQQGAADLSVLGSYVISDLAESGIPIKMAIPKKVFHYKPLVQL